MPKRARRRRPPVAPARRAGLRAWRADLVVLAAALAVRGLYLLSIHDAPFFSRLQTEPLHYHQWATAILDRSSAPWPPFEQAPGYPYFVAALYALFGPTPLFVAIAQAVVDSLSCVLIARITRCYFGARPGLIAGVLAALYGPSIHFSAEPLPSTLFLFLILAAMLAALPTAAAPLLDEAPATARNRQRLPAPSRWTRSAFLWSAAMLVRSEAVLALPFVFAEAWQRGGWAALRRVLLISTLAVGVWLGINAAGSGRLVLFTTSGGVNLWLGNNPHADGVNPFVHGPLLAVDEIVRARAATAVDADRMLRQQAFGFWREQPTASLWLAWKKFLWTWTDRELANTSDIDWQRAQSWLFWPRALPLSFGMLLPLALAGLVLVGSRLPRLTLLFAPAAIAVGTCIVFFTNARFRLPLALTLLPLAAMALHRAPSLVRGRHRTQLAVVAAAGLGVLLGWNNAYGVRNYRIPETLVNAGIVEREAGRFEAAALLLQQGVEARPQDSIAWVHLALALEQAGRTAAALDAYFSALVFADDADVRDMAKRFFQRHRLDESLLDIYIAAPNVSVQTDIAAAARRQLRGVTPPAGDSR